jgi:ABC-2 type transport system ATP-binding protein
MEEAESLADRAVVMARGRVVAAGTPRELAQRLEARAVVTFRLPRGVSPSDLPGLPGEVSVSPAGITVRSDRPTGALAILAGWAVVRGIELEALSVSRPTLEDVYVRLASEAGPE